MLSLLIGPQKIRSFEDLWQYAQIGPIPGQIVLMCGFLFQGGLVTLALINLKGQRAAGRVR